MLGKVVEVNRGKHWALIEVPKCTRPALALFRSVENCREGLHLAEVVSCDVRIDGSNLRAEHVHILTGSQERAALAEITASRRWSC